MGGIRREKEGYIPVSGPVNKNQKILTKEAIVVLLRKGRQSHRQIAEHFGLTEGVVQALLNELVKAGRVERVGGSCYLIEVPYPFKNGDSGEK